MQTNIEVLLTRPISEIAEESTTNPFDCIIVGGGTTGLIFATELGRLGKRVALLEAGSCSMIGHVNNSELRYNGTLARNLQRQLEYSPSLSNGQPFGSFISVLGGRGLFWNGSAPRFQPSDLINWPISFKELTPYYELAEKEFRVNTILGDGNLAQSLIEKGNANGFVVKLGPFAVDHRSSTQGIIGGTIGNGLAILLHSGTLRETSDSKVKIASRCVVQKVLLNSAGDTARGVSVLQDDKAFELYAKSVVLAAGAFESVRIALNSQIPDPDRLIGKRICEHIFCRAYYPVPPSYYGSEPEVALLHVPSSQGERFQLELHTPGMRIFRIRDKSDWAPAETLDYAAMVRSFGSILTRNENYIELIDSNKLGGYKVHLEWSDKDFVMVEKMKMAMESFRQALGLSSATIEVRSSGSSYHESGGLWMGKRAQTSVTTPEGRFHRVHNLVSGDAANWPDLPASNPHISLAAFAFFKAKKLAKNLN